MQPSRDQPHAPGPSLWPIGFAIGIACVLVGLIVSTPALVVGAAIAVVSAFLWIRDTAGGYATPATFVSGLTPAIWVGAAIVGIGALVALLVPGRRSRYLELEVETPPAVLQEVAELV